MKNFIGTLLLTTLINNINPAVNNNTKTISIDSTENYAVARNPDTAQPGQEIDYFKKQNFSIDAEAYNIVGVNYSYNYGTPTATNHPTIKDEYIASDRGWYDDLKNTPKSITFMTITNYKKLDEFNLELYFTYISSFISLRNHYALFYSTNSDLNSIYNNAGWQNQTFFNEVYSRLDNGYLYTYPLVRSYENFSNQFSYNFEDEDPQLNGQTYYLVYLQYLTTNSSSSTTLVQLAAYYLNLNANTNFYVSWTIPDVNITQEVIDIPDIMFTILTMPFSFVSQAFNLTLFAGTKYQINISALFLAIIGVMIFIFLLKLIISNLNKG